MAERKEPQTNTDAPDLRTMNLQDISQPKSSTETDTAPAAKDELSRDEGQSRELMVPTLPQSRIALSKLHRH